MSTLRDELQHIYDQHKAVSPRLVVDAARNDPNGYPALRKHLQWDDEVAGEQFRLTQAANLIRSMRVVYKENARTGETTRRRAYVSTAENTRPSEYLATEDALSDPFTRTLVLRQFERAILALKRQYGHLKEYDEMLRRHGLTEQDVA